MGKSQGRKTVRFTDDFPLALRNSSVLTMYISEQDNDSIQQIFTECSLSKCVPGWETGQLDERPTAAAEKRATRPLQLALAGNPSAAGPVPLRVPGGGPARTPARGAGSRY